MTQKHFRRIGLWGGSFNPPTLAHKALADFTFSQLELDEMRWVICPHNVEKDPATLAPFEHRYAMVDMVLCNDEYMIPDDIEQKQGSSLTVDTVSFFREKYPEDYLFFLMGADNWLGFHKWGDRDTKAIFDKVSIIVMHRPGYPSLSTAVSNELFAEKQVHTVQSLKKSNSFLIIENPLYDVAATNVRKQIANNQHPEHIDKDVFDYIKKHNLYT